MFEKLLLTIACLSFLNFSHAQERPDTSSLAADTTTINKKTDVEPSYPGGQKGWQDYLTSHMEYPGKARSRRIQGAVIMQFMVDSTGNVSDITVADGPKLLRQESIKLIANSGKWVPASSKGMHVSAYKKVVIYYALEEIKKHEPGDVNVIKVL